MAPAKTEVGLLSAKAHVDTESSPTHGYCGLGCFSRGRKTTHGEDSSDVNEDTYATELSNLVEGREEKSRFQQM